MKHRIYERMLHETYTKLNKGLEYIHDVWGHGCPLGMEPITYEELEHDRKTSPYSEDGFRIIIPERHLNLERPSIFRFLKVGGEAYRNHPESKYTPPPVERVNIDINQYKYSKEEDHIKFLESINFYTTIEFEI